MLADQLKARAFANAILREKLTDAKVLMIGRFSNSNPSVW